MFSCTPVNIVVNGKIKLKVNIILSKSFVEYEDGNDHHCSQWGKLTKIKHCTYSDRSFCNESDI